MFIVADLVSLTEKRKCSKCSKVQNAVNLSKKNLGHQTTSCTSSICL